WRSCGRPDWSTSASPGSGPTIAWPAAWRRRLGRCSTSWSERTMSKVLFVCKQNAGRSQMSEALFSRATGARHESRSAGTRPAEHVHPVVAEAMREIGIDIAGNRPQKLTDDLGQWADVVITMGCGDECPYIPGKRYIDWELEDPAEKPVAEVRAIRDDIARRVEALVGEFDAPRPGRAPT